MKVRRGAVRLGGFLLGAGLLAVMCGGDLAPPPGPIQPTMKTLDQVEPRIPIGPDTTPGSASASFLIHSPGSYYLTGDLAGEAGKDGIGILSSDVTIDLNGFIVQGVPGSETGIRNRGAFANITIHNGSVQDWDTGGIDATGVAIHRLEGLTVVRTGGIGIDTGHMSLVRGCVVRQNAGDGIRVSSSGSTVCDNTCYLNGLGGTGANIRVQGNDNRIERNLCEQGATGLDVFGTGNYVADNIVIANTTNYDFTSGNQLNLVISELPQSIDVSATVTLAGDLLGAAGESGLIINADGVTVDLGGHTLRGVIGSLNGIVASAARNNVTIRNGRIAGWGGVGLGAGLMNNSRIESLLVSGNGDSGVVVGISCILDRVLADNNAGNGIFVSAACILSGCVARDNGGAGILTGTGSALTGCTASANTGNGIHVSSGSTVTASSCRANGGNGIEAGAGSHIAQCASTNSTLDGIRASGSCLLLGNSCQGNGSGGDGAGIHATGGDNRIEANNCSGADRGIDVDAAGNFITRNTCSGNTTNWDVVAGNVCLVVSAAAGPAILGNSGGAAPGSTDPNANFTY